MQPNEEESPTESHASLEGVVQERVRDLRQVNEKLRISEARYKSVVEDQTEFIVRWLPDGTQTFANAAFCRCFGITGEERQNFYDLIHEGDRSSVRAKITNLSRDQPAAVDEHRVILPDKTIGWQQWVDRAIFDDYGRLVEYQSVGRDITDRKQSEKQLAEHRAMLAQASRLSAMSEMAAELIHEINQPLVAIHNYAQAIQHAASQGERADLDFIKRCCESIESVSSDASLVIGRLRTYAARRELNSGPTQINDVILKSLELLHFDLQSAQVSVDLQLAADLSAVEADPVQIEQVIVNLLRNALEVISGFEGGNPITVRTCQREDCVVISISDNGPGMADNLVGTVFQPFQTSKEGGLGLGLAISESIVSAHHGRIWYEALEPHGACFQFTLPRSP